MQRIEMQFGGATFEAIVMEHVIELVPKQGHSYMDAAGSCPTEQELSVELGYPVRFIDRIGTTRIYAYH